MRWVGLLLGLLGTGALACGDDGATVPVGTGGAGNGGSANNGSGGAGTGASAANGSGGAGVGGGAPVECPRTPLAAGVSQQQITFDGKDRVYEVEVPISYDNQSAVPLVFDLHGYTSDKDQQELISGFSDLAETEGFVVVRVDGFNNSWNGGDVCCGDAHAQNLDDVGLLRAIATEVGAGVCIDPKRIYSSGLSNGAALSNRVGCEAADFFAAIAPVSYPIDLDPIDECAPSRPIGMLAAQGTNDLVIPYDGGGFNGVPSAAENFAYWALVNGCTGDPTETYTKGSSHCDTYQSCSGGVEVTLCTVNGGHVLYTDQSDGVPIAELAWQHLKKHALP